MTRRRFATAVLPMKAAAMRWMPRESVRHTISSLIAALANVALVGSGLALDLLQPDAPISQISITLQFGLYGPVYLVVSWLIFRRREGEELREMVRMSADRSRLVRWIFLTSPPSWAATVLLIGVTSVVLLTTGTARGGLWVVPIAIIGVAGSWVLMAGVMAFEYMRSWANSDSMTFPAGDERSVTDFIYLSIHQSTTFSSADVQFTRRGIRGLASLHSVLAFAYSTAIIAVFASLLITLTT